jgi:two-component system cell cycle response regulator
MNERIFVVDDNHLNVRLLTDILQDENYTVFSLDNGLPVLEMAKKLMPDVILLDIMMPGIDGFEVCKLLKSDEDVRDIPVIMVTAKTEGYDIKKALEYGAFDYIKKPVDEVEVIARVQSALRLKEYQDRLKQLAMKDGLTNLYNHSLLVELFEKELSKQERNHGDIAFVMLDIDYFKKVNDTYGHDAGNRILKQMALILKNSVRKSDIVARYGGEEFSIILPEIDKQNAFLICDRIREYIEAYDFDIGDKCIKVTVSMGIFFKDANYSISGSEIMQNADELLYKAKENGRNRVEI